MLLRSLKSVLCQHASLIDLALSMLNIKSHLSFATELRSLEELLSDFNRLSRMHGEFVSGDGHVIFNLNLGRSF